MFAPEGERHRLYRLLKDLFPIRILASAAKAGTEQKPVIAPVNRCATQNQVQKRLFSTLFCRCGQNCCV
jgi:hypothetical protein